MTEAITTNLLATMTDFFLILSPYDPFFLLTTYFNIKSRKLLFGAKPIIGSAAIASILVLILAIASLQKSNLFAGRGDRNAVVSPIQLIFCDLVHSWRSAVKLGKRRE